MDYMDLQVILCGDHMIRLSQCDLEDKLRLSKQQEIWLLNRDFHHRKESSLALAFVSEHYPVVFKDSILSSLLNKMGNGIYGCIF